MPPDVVYFDRFAVGEWAARGALTDLTPFLEAQDAEDPNRIRLEDFYGWSVDEVRYRRPGSEDAGRIYGIPTTADIRLLYLNADLLRREGLADRNGVPRPPRNWEELRSYANRLTRYKAAGDRSSPITQLGFAPNFGNSWLYLYAWQAGGELLSPDRTQVTMNLPEVVRALRYMRDIYDDLGGYAKVDAFQQSFQQGALDPFVRDQVALKIDGDWALARIADWRPEMDFVLVPPPLPQDRIDQGHQPLTWAGGWSYVIPATSRNREGAFQLIQHLTSWESVRTMERIKREQRESEGKFYLPRSAANRVHFEKLVEEHVRGNADLPPAFQEAYRVIEKMLPEALVRPVSPVGQLLWGQHIRAYDAAVNHFYDNEAARSGKDPVEMSLTAMQHDVQKRLDELLAPSPPRVVNWTPWFVFYGILVLLPLVGIGYAACRPGRFRRYNKGEVRDAMIFASPWMVGFAVILGGPLFFSVVFSFTQYDVLSPARYVGLDNYTALLSDPVFYTSLANTAFMLVRIPLHLGCGLGIALLLNHSLRGMGVYRTIFYLPAIMPLVAASLLWIGLLNPSYGLINQGLGWIISTPPVQWLEAGIAAWTGTPFAFQPPLWLQDAAWSKPALVLMNVWTAGGSMVIWLAGLQSIPRHLYEAASIDGAGVWHRFRHITLPMLSPYILFNLIIGLIATMQIFGEAYIMTAGGPVDSTLFYAYYLFKQAFQYFRMGYASALAWILFIVVLALTVSQLWLSKKWVNYDQT